MNQTFEQVRVTPKMAQEWLKLNKVNRPISYRTVNTYADDMSHGRWDSNTTSCIAFDEEGYMVDGQHRLTAITVANVPVILWVCRNVGKNVVFDSGRNRSLSDFMNIAHPEMEDRYHSNKVLALIKTLIAYNNHTNSFSRVSPRELEDFIYCHKLDFDIFFSIIPLTHVAKVTVAVVYVSMFMAYKAGVELSSLEHYFYVLSNGTSESERDFPIIAYRDYLLKSSSSVRPTISEIKRCQLSIKKYLTKSNIKRTYEPQELIWKFPYGEEENS